MVRWQGEGQSSTVCVSDDGERTSLAHRVLALPRMAPVLRLGSKLGRVIRSPGRYSTEIEELT